MENENGAIQNLDNGFEAKFRRKAMEKTEYKKGAFKEAIKDGLEKKVN